MGMMTFRGKYGFLSNMYSVDFEWDGRTYHSSEAAFQSAKSLNPAERDRFTEMSGVTAKREGKKVSLRADWEDVKEDLMEEILMAKFSQNPDIARQLIDTGDMELVEGNRWHDTYWGVDVFTGKGENRLGKLLMKVRAALGGEGYLDAMTRLRAEREAEKQRARAELIEKIESTKAQLDALSGFDFSGKEFRTKAFGIVTIKRQEGDVLVFEARGAERKFALPGCITQGFLIPEDPTVIEQYRMQQELTAQLAQLQKEIETI